MEKIEKVFIVGGTHGNEQIGGYLVKNMEKKLIKNQYSFEIKTILANPKAFRRKIRFIDADLNRLFKIDELENLEKSSYEHERARVIHQMIGSKGDNNIFLIDLHTTNANMGTTIMTAQQTPFQINLLNYIATHVKGVNIYFSKNLPDRPNLNSLAHSSLLIEVGGVANNTLRSDVYFTMKKIISHALDFLEQYQLGTLQLDNQLTIKGFKSAGAISYPRDEYGELLGMIHPSIQDQDLKKVIKKGDPIFKLFTGEDVFFDKEGEYLMAFINESAYYDENVAFYLIDEIESSSK